VVSLTVEVQKLGDDPSNITRDTADGRERSLRWTKERREMTQDEAANADRIDIRCLNICIGMLKQIHGVRVVSFPICSGKLIIVVRALKTTQRWREFWLI
jgi:hypothetical protein